MASPLDRPTPKPTLTATFLGGELTGPSAAARAITAQVHQLEQNAVRQRMLPGSLTSGQAEALGGIFSQLEKMGLPYQASILDNTTLRIHLMHQNKRVGQGFTMPLDVGGYITGAPEYIRDLQTEGVLPEVQRAAYAARGVAFPTEVAGKRVWQQQSFGQALGSTISSEMAGLRPSSVGGESLLEAERHIQRVINKSVADNAMWVGRSTGPLDPGFRTVDLYGRSGSLMDVFQAGKVRIMAGRNLVRTDPITGEITSTPRMLDRMAAFPLITDERTGEITIDPSASMEEVKRFTRLSQEMRASGLRLSHEALSDEGVLGSSLSMYRRGEIVPFGESAVRHQMYQRLGITKVAGRMGARSVPSVSTPVVEAMKREAEKQFGSSWGQWTAEGRVALVLDSGFEMATAASGGGAIITSDFASQLAADVTQQVDYETAATSRFLERRGDRWISRAGTGTTLITSGGTKHTVGAVLPSERVRGAQMAIGWREFINAKSPEAVREAIIRDIVDQVGPYQRGVRFGKRGENFKRLARKQMDDINKAKAGLLHGVADILGDTKVVGRGTRGVYGLQPQMQIGPDAQLTTKHLADISDVIKTYNAQVKTLWRAGYGKKDINTVREFFEEGQFTVWDEQGQAREFKALMMNMSVMRRLEQQALVTKAVGMGKVGQEGMYWFHPKGTKLRPKDITSLRSWQSKEANALADEYTRIASKWQSTAKREFWKTVGPFIKGGDIAGVEGVMGFPDIKGAVELDKLKRYMEAPFGARGITIDRVKESIFASDSPLRGKGVTVKLPSAITIAGVFDSTSGEMVESLQTRQLHLPGLDMYRGISKDADEIYINKLLKSHENLYAALSATNPSMERVERSARDYYELLGQELRGKKGLLSYLTTARMAHSGYMSLTPGGVGKDARLLGTALESPAVIDISEETARKMGVFKHFQADDVAGKGFLYGRMTAYPSTSQTTETAFLFRMVQDSELGRNQLRVSNAVALSMFRDFDADKAGVTFFLGRKAQELSKAFYEKDIKTQIMGEHRLLRFMAGESKQLKDAMSAVRDEAHSLRYDRILEVADRVTRDWADKGDLQISAKFLTKQLTPAVNTFLQQFRELNAMQGILPAADAKSRALVGSALGVIEQQIAIAKGGVLPEGARDAFRWLSGSYATVEAEANAVNSLSNFLLQTATGKEKLQDAMALSTRQRIVAAAQKGGKSYDYAMAAASTTQLRQTAQNLVDIAKVRHTEMLQADVPGRMPGFGAIFKKKSQEIGSTFMGVLRALTGHTERVAQGRTPFIAGVEGQVTDFLEMSKHMGMVEAGTDIAAVQMAANAHKAKLAEIAAANQVTKDAGKLGGTVLDRVTNWFGRADVPYWQKAGVITGAALVAGAAVKSMFFPGYGPDAPPPSHPSEVFTPPPMVVSPPIVEPSGPMAPQPHRMHKKPGGLWGYVSSQVGYSPEVYGVEAGNKMAQAVPNFGRRVSMPGMGLDIGPGIADSQTRPFIVAGPPVGGGAPMPPAMPDTPMPHVQEMGAMPGAALPSARVALPDHMRFGQMLSFRSPGNADMTALMEAARMGDMGDSVSIDMMDDPMENATERWQAIGANEGSSFT